MNRRDDEDALEPKWRAYSPEEWDRRYMKYKLPYLMTPEEKDEYRDNEWWHWYNPWEDGRDCTGVWFTTSIRLIDCGNETIVIHTQSMDV